MFTIKDSNFQKNLFTNSIFDKVKFERVDFSKASFDFCQFIDCEFIDILGYENVDVTGTILKDHSKDLNLSDEIKIKEWIGKL